MNKALILACILLPCFAAHSQSLSEKQHQLLDSLTAVVTGQTYSGINSILISSQINNVEVFSTAYEKTCGLITGPGFISNRLCAVDFVQLKTADGKDIYSNDFDH
jgi:hypothetical protein